MMITGVDTNASHACKLMAPFSYSQYNKQQRDQDPTVHARLYSVGLRAPDPLDRLPDQD